MANAFQRTPLLRTTVNALGDYLSGRANAVDHPTSDRATTGRTTLIAVCAFVFLLATGVRLLHLSDAHAEIDKGGSLSTALIKDYLRETARMREDGILFPSTPPQDQDARMILHPPGYAMLLYVLGEDKVLRMGHWQLRFIQLLCDSLSALLVCLVGGRLFRPEIGAVAGVLAALSPHLAYYSLWLTPETLAIPPLLLAVFLLARGREKLRVWHALAAGVLIGISCWLRANALLLSPAIALAMPLLAPARRKLFFAGAILAATAATISPITIRNWVVYHRFIPLSLGAGITMAEGIADYDLEDRFGMPSSDLQAKHKDAEWHNRPDYDSNIWVPDGVERDRARLARAGAVVRDNPVWFAGVMIRRAGSMLRYNDSYGTTPTSVISRAPVISSEPAFGHRLEPEQYLDADWTATAAELNDRSTKLAPQAEAVCSPNQSVLEIIGDQSQFGDLSASDPIPIRPQTDYVLRLDARNVRGGTAAKITSSDRRISLGTASLIVKEPNPRRAAKHRARLKMREHAADSLDVDDPGAALRTFEIPFASGARSEALLVIANNGGGTMRPVVQIGTARLHAVGPTPGLWTRFVRPLVRGLQRNLFTTVRMLLLVAVGALLAATARRWYALIAILIVPLYYLTFQSTLHTEYRYTVVIHYFLFVVAAAAICTMVRVFVYGCRRILELVRLRLKRDALVL